MSDIRKQINDVLFGGNGSGKTTLVLQIVADYIEKNPEKRILFILPDDQEKKLRWIEEIPLNGLETFTGIKKMIIEEEQFFGRLIDKIAPPHAPKCGYHNGDLCNCGARDKGLRFDGLMVIDDPNKYMSRRPKDVLRLFVRRRQPNLDMLWCFHGLRNVVPPSFYTYVTRLIIFQTSDDYGPTYDLLPENKREEFLDIYRRVQRIADTEDPHYCEELILRRIT